MESNVTLVNETFPIVFLYKFLTSYEEMNLCMIVSTEYVLCSFLYFPVYSSNHWDNSIVAPIFVLETSIRRNAFKILERQGVKEWMFYPYFYFRLPIFFSTLVIYLITYNVKTE